MEAYCNSLELLLDAYFNEIVFEDAEPRIDLGADSRDGGLSLNEQEKLPHIAEECANILIQAAGHQGLTNSELKQRLGIDNVDAKCTLKRLLNSNQIQEGPPAPPSSATAYVSLIL